MDPRGPLGHCCALRASKVERAPGVRWGTRGAEAGRTVAHNIVILAVWERVACSESAHQSPCRRVRIEHDLVEENHMEVDDLVGEMA